MQVFPFVLPLLSFYQNHIEIRKFGEKSYKEKIFERQNSTTLVGLSGSDNPLIS